VSVKLSATVKEAELEQIQFNFFDVLGAPMIAGRSFTAADLASPSGS
jgi:hypothetical protein